MSSLARYPLLMCRTINLKKLMNIQHLPYLSSCHSRSFNLSAARCLRLTERKLSDDARRHLTLDSEIVKRYIQHLADEYAQVRKQVTDIMLSADPTSSTHQMNQLNGRLRELEPIVSKIKLYQQYTTEIAELQDIISSSNEAELCDIARNDIASLEALKSAMDGEVFSLLVPPITGDKNDIILEVSAGVGGQEAMLFTKEIFDMYVNYATYKGWSADVMDYEPSDLGGLRHAMASIAGHSVFMQMKYEGGVHRVQRVPKTEKSGRVHTSTMTVAILAQPTEVDVIINSKDLRIDTFRASGKGGQHVNTTDSAVRIVHLPTGTVAECQVERSQMRNKETALRILRTRLYEKEVEKKHFQQSSSRKLQVGSAGRSEKIRTYNVKDDRVTDHRISDNVYGVDSVLQGGKQLDILINMVHLEQRQERLLELLNKYK